MRKIAMSKRYFATADAGMNGDEKPVLWLCEGNCCTRIATFVDTEAKKTFLKIMEEQYQAHQSRDTDCNKGKIGVWKKHQGYYKCSLCGATDVDPDDICPGCGATMAIDRTGRNRLWEN